MDSELYSVVRDFHAADLTRANLRGADLAEADLYKADLTRADLTEADLRGANLRGANLTEADLTEADLRGADLRGADLTRANLCGANLCGANLDFSSWPLWGGSVRVIVDGWLAAQLALHGALVVVDTSSGVTAEEAEAVEEWQAACRKLARFSHRAGVLDAEP